jgi:hypothetical protein
MMDGELHNWSHTTTHGMPTISGTLFNDPQKRFLDGTRVNTSKVRSIDGDIVVTSLATYRLVGAEV